MLRERGADQGTLEFRGVKNAEEPLPFLRERGRIVGLVVRVGGTGDRIPVLLESDGELISGCQASREVAKALAGHLFEHVRLDGEGSWLRDAQGRWKLRRFNISTFEPVDATTVSEALAELRAVAGDWTEADYRDLERTRRGRQP